MYVKATMPRVDLTKNTETKEQHAVQIHLIFIFPISVFCSIFISILAMPVQVTRLIRTAYGDYQLQTIPPGMAIEVPVKPIVKQKHRGELWKTGKVTASQRRQQQHQDIRPPLSAEEEERAQPVQWIRRY